MDNTHYQSKSQKKRIEHQLEADTFIKEKKEKAILDRWEEAQITAAGWQSVFDYAVEQYHEHKEELEEDVITKTEELIKERQADIEKYLMQEKDIYLEAMGIQAD
jgi:hypothetical protein